MPNAARPGWTNNAIDYSQYGDPSFESGKFGSVEAPEPSMALKGIYNQQYNIAKDYQSKIPETQGQLYGNYAQDSKRNLAQNIKGVQKDFNSRGLLRSGLRQGAEAQERANSASDLAASRFKINQQVMDTSDQLFNNALNSMYAYSGQGLGLGASAANNTTNQVNNSISGMQANQSVFSGLGQGLGSLAGQIAYNNRAKLYNPGMV